MITFEDIKQKLNDDSTFLDMSRDEDADYRDEDDNNNDIKIYDAELKIIIEFLKDHGSVEKVCLRNNKIGELGAQAVIEFLKDHGSIKEIDLDGNDDIKPETIRIMKGLLFAHEVVEDVLGSNPTELDVSCKQLGDAGIRVIVEALKFNKTVAQLNISNNYIGMLGAEAVAELLTVNPFIKQVNVFKNKLGDEGARVIVDSLKNNSSLTHLYLRGNKISSSVMPAIENVLQSNTTLIHFYVHTDNLITRDKAILEGSEAELRVTISSTQDSELMLGLTKAIDIYLERNKTLKKLLINNLNLIQFINQHKLLLNNKTYKSIDNFIVKGNENLQKVELICEENVRNHIKITFLSSGLSYEDKKEACNIIKKQYFKYAERTLINCINSYIQNSYQDEKLDLNIKDKEGYTILGVIILHCNKSIGRLFFDTCESDEPFKDIMMIAEFYNVKLSPELRIVINKTYITFLDVLFSHYIFSGACQKNPTNYQVWKSYTKLYDRSEFSSAQDLLLEWWHDCVSLLRYIDTSFYVKNDLILGCFENVEVYKDLVNIMKISPSMDEGIWCEMDEEHHCQILSEFIGSSILSFCATDFILNLHHLMSQKGLVYDATKLNPVTGFYAFGLHCYNTADYERLSALVKLAHLSHKKIDFNHRDDFDGTFLNHYRHGLYNGSDRQSDIDDLCKISREEGQVLDINTFLHFGRDSLSYQQKKGYINTWSVFTRHDGIAAAGSGVDSFFTLFSEQSISNQIKFYEIAKQQKSSLTISKKNTEAHLTKILFSDSYGDENNLLLFHMLDVINANKGIKLTLHNLIGCDIYLMSQLPSDEDEKKDLSSHKNTYIFIKKEPFKLYYVSSSGSKEELKFDINKFNTLLAKIINNDESISLQKNKLTNELIREFWSLITANEGHMNLKTILKISNDEKEIIEEDKQNEENNEEVVSEEEVCVGKGYYGRLALLLYQATLNGFKLLPNFTSICPDQACSECRPIRSRYANELKKDLKGILLPEVFTEVCYVFSVLFAHYVEEWRHFIKYAEDNEIPIDLAASHEGRAILERAVLAEDIMVLQSILFYALRNNIKIDFEKENDFGDTLLEAALNNKDKLAMIFEYIENNPELVSYREKDKHEALRVLCKYDEVLAYYNDKSDADSLYFKARIFQDQKKLEETENIYNQIIKTTPKFANAYYGKALLFVEQGKNADAISLFNKAISANPHNPLYDINKAKVLLEMGEREKAMRLFEGVDVKVATKFIDQLFTPAQKELFIQVTQAAKTWIERDNGSSSGQQEKQVIEKVFDAFNSGVKINYAQAMSFKEELEKLKQQLVEVKQTLKDASVEDAAEINRNIKALKEQDTRLYVYYAAFYWTLTNYLDAYRQLSTGMIQGTGKLQGNAKVNTLATINKGLESTNQYIEKIPFAGNIASIVSSLVRAVVKHKHEAGIEDSIATVMRTLLAFCETSDALEKAIAKAALAITQHKSSEILSPAENIAFSKATAIKQWLRHKLEGLDPNIGQQAEEEKLALQDVGLLMACLIEKKMTLKIETALDEQLVALVTQHTHAHLLTLSIDAPLTQALQSQEASPQTMTAIMPTENISSEVPLKPQPTDKGGCCQVMAVHEIKYDNPLLNYPELLCKFSRIYGKHNLSKLIDFGEQLDKPTSSPH